MLKKNVTAELNVVISVKIVGESVELRKDTLNVARGEKVDIEIRAA